MKDYRINKKDVPIYILDYKEIPTKGVKVKLNTSFYFDMEGYPIQDRDDIYALENKKPKLNENYFMYKTGKVGIIRNIKDDISKYYKFNEIDFIDELHYNPLNYIDTEFENGYIIIFNDFEHIIFENAEHFLDYFAKGKFNLFKSIDIVN